MDEILKMLVNADTGMVAVTTALVQVIKRALPSPVPEDPKKPVNLWSVERWLQWVPYAASFVIGTALAMLLSLVKDMGAISLWRTGLQTGAYSVVVWEGYSSVVKPAVERMFGQRPGP